MNTEGASTPRWVDPQASPGFGIVDRASLFLWVVACVGYFGPWITRRPASAALSWNAYDLFALLRLLPEIESGAVRVNLQALQLPSLALALLLPVLTAHGRTFLRIGSTLVSTALALLTFPPYPEIITAWRTPGWRVPFWWGVGTVVCAWLAVWAAPRIGKTRHWVCMVVALITIIPAAATLSRLLPPLRSLHNAAVGPGWGFWGCTAGLGVIGLLSMLRALEVIDGHHPR